MPTAQASAGPDADTLARLLSVSFVAPGLTVDSTFQIEAVDAPAGAARVAAPAVTAAAASRVREKRGWDAQKFLPGKWSAVTPSGEPAGLPTTPPGPNEFNRAS